MIEPVKVVVVLDTDIDTAFSTFVAQINNWWPVKSFSIAQGVVTLDPVIDGKIIETADDGTQHQWGHVTAWHPPHHLAVSWYVGEAAQPTAITVDFAATDDGRTCVTLIHTGWDALGDEGVSKRDNYRRGWKHILIEGFAAYVAETCTPLPKGPT